MNKSEILGKIVILARESMQEHLDDYGHGTVDDVDIEELGWSEDCLPVMLITALREYKNFEEED